MVCRRMKVLEVERFAGWKGRAEVKPEILYIPARLNRFRNDGPKHEGNRA